MLAEGNDSSIELLEDRVVVRRGKKVTAEVPICDVSEVRFRAARAFNDGYLQIVARETAVNGMDGTAFFKGKSELLFETLGNAIREQISTPAVYPDAPSVPEPTVASMKVMLSSGSWIEIDHVRLYALPRVTEIQSLRAQAAKAMGGGAAVGVIGAPSMALAAEAVAVSVISGLLASANQRQAIEALNKAQVLHQRMLLDEGVDMPLREISRIAIPQPGVWRGKSANLELVHSGDEFIHVGTPQGPFSIKWSDVSVTKLIWAGT